MKAGRAGTVTHDYKRHGTTTLFAALDVKSGLVIGDCMPRHRAKEFLKHVPAQDRPRREEDPDEIHRGSRQLRHPQDARGEGLAFSKYPRFQSAFLTPTTASWINLVERCFAEIT